MQHKYSQEARWIGPVVVGAISESTSNIWMGWPFVLGLLAVAAVIVLFIDVDAAKQELAVYESAAGSEEATKEKDVIYY